MGSTKRRISDDDLIGAGFRAGWVRPFDDDVRADSAPGDVDQEAATDANSNGTRKLSTSRAAENKRRHRDVLRSQGFLHVSTDAKEEFVKFINQLGILSRQGLRLDEALDRITAADPDARRLAKSLLTVPEEARSVVERLIRSLVDGNPLDATLDAAAGIDRQAELRGKKIASLRDEDLLIVERLIQATADGTPLQEAFEMAASIERRATQIGSRVLAATRWRQRIIGRLIDIRLPDGDERQRKTRRDR